jgi:hypothetical protein
VDAPASVTSTDRGFLTHGYCRQLITIVNWIPLDFLGKVVYDNCMARPKKDPAMRMDADVRIPVTAEQKAVLVRATADEPAGMAAWARHVLLDAARRRIMKAKSDSHSASA